MTTRQVDDEDTTVLVDPCTNFIFYNPTRTVAEQGVNPYLDVRVPLTGIKISKG